MLNSTAHRLFRKLGFDVHKVSKARSINAKPIADPFAIQKSLLNSYGITEPTIFDVGAHRGETVQRYKTRFATSMIYCFEPFPTSLEILRGLYQNDANVKIIPLAIADEPGER